MYSFIHKYRYLIWITCATIGFFLGGFIREAFGSIELDQCIQVCNDKYPVIIADKLFPDNLTFEDVTDKGIGDYKGTAAVLFPAKWEGKVLAVTMNGEEAFHGESYKGRPVFRFRKVGGEYTKPLKFLIETKSGNYSYSIGSYISDNNNPPSGTKSASYTYYNIGDKGRTAWRIKEPASKYGKTIKFTFKNGYSFVVPDSTKRFTNNDGVIFRPGTGKSVKNITKPEETSHGGIYLYGPYGNTSKEVKLEW